MVDGAEGPDTRVFLSESLAQTQGDLSFGGRAGVIGKREGVPVLGRADELAD